MKLRNDEQQVKTCVLWQDGQTGRQAEGWTVGRTPTVVLQYKSEGCGDAGRSGGRCVWYGNRQKAKTKNRQYSTMK